MVNSLPFYIFQIGDIIRNPILKFVASLGSYLSFLVMILISGLLRPAMSHVHHETIEKGYEHFRNMTGDMKYNHELELRPFEIDALLGAIMLWNAGTVNFIV